MSQFESTGLGFEPTDAIIALGGGLDPQGLLLPRNFSRMDTAIELFQQGVAPHLVVTGGWWMLDKRPERVEAEQLETYALEKNVPQAAIFTEPNARESIGNAVLTKQEILAPKGWKRVTLVTSESHLGRSVELFDYVLGDEYTITGVPAPEQKHAAGLKEKVYEGVATLMAKHVLRGTERGNDESIRQSLVERIPGYGGTVTAKQLAMNSLLSAAHLPTIRPKGRHRLAA